ncbi:hypothetical protein F0562_001914 [Nyssa sinensis]|uniref:Uncharacterized protein n=1 Tax=Nyssa sinensis TaxID=561372 RepID=A0A5J5C8B4_9ASTE|nr:hypothetical protein F0562_001914 [Nyssa sinensis]
MLKLSNGIGKGKRQDILAMPLQMPPAVKMKAITMHTCKIEISTLVISRSSHRKADSNIDPFIIIWWCAGVHLQYGYEKNFLPFMVFRFSNC